MRRLKSYGLIAGLTYTEMRRMRPGEIMDYYIWRQGYDDQEHGVKRKKTRCED